MILSGVMSKKVEGGGSKSPPIRNRVKDHWMFGMKNQWIFFMKDQWIFGLKDHWIFGLKDVWYEGSNFCESFDFIGSVSNRSGSWGRFVGLLLS